MSSFSKISDFIWKEKEHFWKAGFAASPENNDLFLNENSLVWTGAKKKKVKAPFYKNHVISGENKTNRVAEQQCFCLQNF